METKGVVTHAEYSDFASRTNMGRKNRKQPKEVNKLYLNTWPKGMRSRCNSCHGTYTGGDYYHSGHWAECPAITREEQDYFERMYNGDIQTLGYGKPVSLLESKEEKYKFFYRNNDNK